MKRHVRTLQLYDGVISHEAARTFERAGLHLDSDQRVSEVQPAEHGSAQARKLEVVETSKEIPAAAQEKNVELARWKARA